MFLFSLLIPLIMLFIGISFEKTAPKNINPVFGYRTSMSMKNKDTWEFAHYYCGKVFKKVGIVLIPVSALAMLIVIGKSNDTVGKLSTIVCMIQLAALIGSIIPVEIALKKTFDKDGKRK